MSQLREEARSRQVGSPIYMAPEVLSGLAYDTKADIYSFGILLWEMVTQQIPYNNQYKNFADLKTAVLRGERPKFIEGVICPTRLKDLITNCWHPDPNRRPLFRTMLHERIFDTLTVEGLISEQNKPARSMWLAEFLGKWTVTWPEFSKAFEKHMGVNLTQSTMGIEFLKNVLGATNQNQFTVTIEAFSNVLEWFGPVGKGVELIDKICSLGKETWFHGGISQEQAETLLNKNHKEGAFLVRFSTSSPGCFTISCITKDKLINHLKISRKGSGGPFIIGQNSYPSLEFLIKKGALPKPLYCKHAVEGSIFQTLAAGYSKGRFDSIYA